MSNQATQTAPVKSSFAQDLFDFVELLTFALISVLLLLTFFFRHAVVDGSSMQNTLQSGEHLVISDFLYTPARGDIVVVDTGDNRHFSGEAVVKRVIAVAGDEVEIRQAIRDGLWVNEIYINGERLREDYVWQEDDDMHPAQKFSLGEGQLLLCGDHRNASKDSRTVGLIDTRAVLGRVILRITPLSKFGTVN